MRPYIHAAAVLAFLLICAMSTSASAIDPVLCFSDLTGGPRTGNSDTSLGEPAGEDGAIVTVWGKNLGNSHVGAKVFANGAEARVYFWGDATVPADLYSRHRMQMICFQISHAASEGPGEIRVEVGGKRSNALPFTVHDGRIVFVKTSGDDAAAGDWSTPWRTIPRAIRRIAPGDIIYVCDGVTQTVADSYSAAVNLDSDGEADRPKALVAYPGAKCLVGADKIERGFGHWVTGKGHTADHWTVAKFSVTAGVSAILMGSGYRVIGNYVTAPTGSAPKERLRAPATTCSSSAMRSRKSEGPAAASSIILSIFPALAPHPVHGGRRNPAGRSAGITSTTTTPIAGSTSTASNHPRPT